MPTYRPTAGQPASRRLAYDGLTAIVRLWPHKPYRLCYGHILHLN